MLTRLVTSPGAFVERQSKYPGIRTQSILALAGGLAFGAVHLGNFSLLGAAAGNVTGPLWVLPLVNVLLMFLLWVVVTILLYLLAPRLGGYPQIGLLFRVVGWGLAPLIAAGLVQSAGRLYALRTAMPPQEPAIAGFQHEYEVYQTYLAESTGDPAFVAATVLAIPIVLYSGYLWTLALETISELDRRRAAYAVAIPLALPLAWLLAPLVG